MEAGHIAENIYLMAEALGLGTVSVGAFQDGRVQEVISAPSAFIPLYVMPIGHVR
jgi:nitroreductase